MKILAVLALAFWPCFVCISSASADWQYSMWGMTLDEVIAASDGKARRFTDSGQDTDNEKVRAVAPYVAGDFVFDAIFSFNRKNDTLSEVKLLLKDGNGHSLYAALVNRYGKPVSENKDSIVPNARWLDRENNNNIVWLMIGEDYTAVSYRALIGKSEKAL